MSAFSRRGRVQPTLPTGALSTADLERLVAYRARYILESSGFSHREAQRLVWVRWMVAVGRMSEWRLGADR